MSGPEVKRVVVKREKVEQMLRVGFDKEVGRQYQTMAVHFESDGYGGYVLHGMVKVTASAKAEEYYEQIALSGIIKAGKANRATYRQD